MLSNKVKEIMNLDITTVRPDDTIASVMAQMAEKNIGRVIVIDKQLPVGIFTENDVLKRIVNKRLNVFKTGIKKVMTSPVRGVPEDAHIIDVLGKMYRGKFRHMLVRDPKRKMAGLVSMRRILKLAVELGRDLNEIKTIGSIMSGRLVGVDEAQPIYDCVGTMAKQDITCVMVMCDEEPLGIFTERDVLRRVAVKDMDTKKEPVKTVMTPNPVIMDQSALIEEVLAEMYQRDFRNMPIRGTNGKLVGVVTMGDVLKYARALDVDESVRKAWKEIEEYWDSDEQYTPG